MAYRDYELDRDYGSRNTWRGRNDFDRDRWYGGYGAGGYGDWDRGWNRTGYGWGGTGGGAYGPDNGYGGYYGRSEPWYGGGYGILDRGYPTPGGYAGSAGHTGYAGYGGGYGDNLNYWRAGAGMTSEPGMTSNQGRDQNQWRPPQHNHTGRGPRNYRRSDDRIEEDVNEALTRHPGLDASEVDVSVENSEVTLTGTVESRLDKRMAEDAAESCPGVRDVHNQLRVALGAGATPRGTEREVTRTPEQEGGVRGGARGSEHRSGTRQSMTASRSK